MRRRCHDPRVERVVADDLERLVDVVPKYGDQVRAVMLDVTAPAGAARRGTDRYLRVWSSQVVVKQRRLPIEGFADYQ